MKLGIVLERIEARHPEQNGRHERMHRTLKQRFNEKNMILKALEKFQNQSSVPVEN